MFEYVVMDADNGDRRVNGLFERKMLFMRGIPQNKCDIVLSVCRLLSTPIRLGRALGVGVMGLE